MLFITGLQTIPSFGKTDISIIVYDYLLYIASYVLIFYSFYFSISNKNHKKNKIILLLVSGLLFTIIIDLPITYIYLYILSPDVLALRGNEFRIMFTKYYMSFMESNFLFAVSGALLKTALLHYVNTMEQKESEKKLMLGDLALLKSQINPLFLFNTFASIRTLIKTKPDKAIHSIENLSEIMSYMLYDTTAEKIPLDKEINNIKKYLNLQSIRYNKEFIQFSVNGNTLGIYVPPLIFMPIIDNVFKHLNAASETSGVVISFEAQENGLLFSISCNHKENLNKAKLETCLDLETIKKHFDLVFDNNYEFEIETEPALYILKLWIKPVAAGQ